MLAVDRKTIWAHGGQVCTPGEERHFRPLARAARLNSAYAAWSYDPDSQEHPINEMPDKLAVSCGLQRCAFSAANNTMLSPSDLGSLGLPEQQRKK
jgi:hypothetical protein